MEKNQYIPIMLQSLKKKEQILDAIMALNDRQREELENPSLDPDDFDKTIEEKAAQIETLEALDAGFQEVYEKVRDELNDNKDAYRDEIARMQDYIRRLTEKSAKIQVEEARNKSLMEQKILLLSASRSRKFARARRSSTSIIRI